MTTPHELHWHEGLFLQPQHFQFWQGELRKQFVMERSWSRSFPYGLAEIKPRVEALAQWRLEFESIKAVMPSGRVIDWPGNAELPTLDLKSLFDARRDALTICLCVPIHFEKRRNTLLADEDGATHRVLFRTNEFEVTDETTGESTRPVLAHRVNCWLLPEEADKANLEFFPILRLVRSTSEDDAVPKIDPHFNGPLFNVSASATITDSLQQLTTSVANSRETAGLQLRRSGFKVQEIRGTQLEQLLRYRTLCQMQAQLPEYYAARQSCPPQTLYAYLTGLTAELAALYPEREEELTTRPYQHETPGLCFRDVFSKIFDLVLGSAQSSFLRVAFERREQGFFAKLEEEHLARPSSYYLGIRTKADMGELAQLVEDRDRFKFMARSLSEKAIFGIKLSANPVGPMQLPAQAGLYYFRLDTTESPRMWEQISKEREIAVRWNGLETSDYELSLYMPLPT